MFTTLRTALAAGLLLCASSARAQDLGLDLSDGPDLRPSIAVLGIGTPKDADAVSKARADKLATALVAATKKTNWFVKVVEPEECAKTLGDAFPAAQACDTADCLVDLARQLGVDRVLTSQVEFPADGPNLKLSAVDAGPGAPSLEVVDVLAQGKSAGFERSVAQAFKPLLQKFSTQVGTLKVVPSEPGATVEVNGRILGTGTVEKPIAAGALKVRVTAPDFQPFEAEVTLESKGKQTVEASLQKKLLTPPPQAGDAPPVEAAKPAAPGTPFYERGGLYLAIAGLAAVGVGVAYAVHANDVKSKMADADKDGVMDVTRWQRNQAIKDAQLANILMGAGGGVALGGALWFIFEPAPSMPGKEKEPGGPKTEPTPVGVLLKIGGEI